MKKENNEMKVMKKRNWKKIAAYTAAGVALIGAGAAFVIKLKNGTVNVIDLSALKGMSLSVFGDGVGYDATLLWDEEGKNVSQMAVEKMTARDVTKMLDIINPDVYGISMDTKWDEIIFIQH